MSEPQRPFTERQFRDAMGQFCTGVVIVTGCEQGLPLGFSAQSFVSLSLQPPLIAISPARSGRTWPRLRATGVFGINILSADQQALCARFAQADAADRFDAVRWTPAPSGAPRIDGAMAYLDCRIEQEHDAGDHTLVVARVTSLEAAGGSAAPLLFFRGAYGQWAARGETGDR